MSTDQNQKKNVVFNALTMAAGTMLSRILGLLRESLLAALFDRHITDAWSAAFRLPNMFRRLLGEGSLSVSFIPVFIDAKLHGDPENPQLRAQNLVNGFYTLLLILLAAITLGGIFYSESILRIILDENYISQPEKFNLTNRMAQIMFGFVFLISTFAYFMGILNALGKFAWAALAPTFFNVALIISTLLPRAWFPVDGDGLAWGVLVGGFFQMAVLVPSLIKLQYFPKLTFNVWSPDIKKVLTNMGPGLLGSGLAQFTTIVNLKFASSLPEGTISYINWADRLLELPLSLVSVSLGTALLPTLASFWSQGDRKSMTESSNYYLRVNLFVAIPVSIGLYFLSRPIVDILFLRGEFTAKDAAATASILGVYAFTVISVSCVRVFVPAYYAIKNTWYPAVVSGVCLVAHILLAPVFMKQWGVLGLMGSSLMSATLNLFLLISAYFFFVGPLGVGQILKSVLKFLIAGSVMIFLLQIYEPISGILGLTFMGKLLSFSLASGIGLVGYLFVSYLLKLEEYKNTVQLVLGKIQRKLKF